ncbi:hypothetical protein [Nitrosomonas oligotropha]|uniref:hypothetical protein n=1 Tax=Nitrosomonas oligotropha TaxID=42354 RepID=UPI0011B27EEE|nr:hypothetical protein [Nitrosomonas oligotropha]
MTTALNRDYSFAQVLKTLQQAECPAPESRGFFASIVFVWPSVGLIKYLPWQGIRQPSCCGFEPSAALSKGAINQNINKEAIMAAQSKSASARCKSKSAIHPETIHLTPQLRSQKARSKAIKELHDFLDYASEAEKRVVGHLKVGHCPVSLMKEIRRLLDESIKQCRVIPFPAEKQQSATL